MKNYLDIEVSYFRNCMDVQHPKLINLLDWLHSVKYKKEVDIIRRTSDVDIRKSLKKKLPVITPSGTFKYRNQNGLIKHSGLIQFDIDLQDNHLLQNYDKMQESLSMITNVAYCGWSASGKGYWGLVPIQDPAMHVEHFEALKEVFFFLGIKIDPAPGNVASTRYYSYDKNGYFNMKATVFKRLKNRLKQVKGVNPRNSFCKKYPDTNKRSIIERLNQVVDHILAKKIDITVTNRRWFEIGCALANELGEGGREYFHAISQFHLKYNPSETDKLFNNCLKKGYNFRFGTIMYHYKAYSTDR